MSKSRHVPIATTPTTSQLILVVEDEPIIRALLCEILECEGFNTKSMENADLALDFLTHQANLVGLLLTDINMPGTINGAELANTSAKLWPSMPIVVMSGFESAQTAGISRSVKFIAKPFSMDNMVAAIHSELSKQH